MLLMLLAWQRLGQEVGAVVFTWSMVQGNLSSVDRIEHGVERDAKVLGGFREVAAFDHVDRHAGVGEERNARLVETHLLQNVAEGLDLAHRGGHGMELRSASGVGDFSLALGLGPDGAAEDGDHNAGRAFRRVFAPSMVGVHVDANRLVNVEIHVTPEDQAALARGVDVDKDALDGY